VDNHELRISLQIERVWGAWGELLPPGVRNCRYIGFKKVLVIIIDREVKCTALPMRGGGGAPP